MHPEKFYFSHFSTFCKFTNQKEKFWGCLVCGFKQQFSVLKQHYTYFHTLFHPHVFLQMFSQGCAKNRRTKKTTSNRPKPNQNFNSVSVQFWFYYVKNRKVRFGFRLQFNTPNRPKDIIIYYIKYIIFCKYWMAALCWAVDLSINHPFILIQLNDSQLAVASLISFQNSNHPAK